MCIDRRNFLRASAGVAGAAMFPSFALANSDEVDSIQQRQDVPDLIRNLRPMTKDRTNVPSMPPQFNATADSAAR